MVPTPGTGYTMDIAARLEADCDNDGLGDETQDSNTASCNPPTTPTVVKKKCKKKKKKHSAESAKKKCKKKKKK